MDKCIAYKKTIQVSFLDNVVCFCLFLLVNGTIAIIEIIGITQYNSYY